MSIAKTRQKLVDVARELFALKGLEETTMNDIALLSGKGRRTLYTYFRNKDEIYSAVIASELERLSEKMDEVAQTTVAPDRKIIMLIYTHLNLIKETVARNGSLRAKFFHDINNVERVRKAFDIEERHILRRVLQEGIAQGKFQVDNVNLLADLLHYAVKGIEIAYMYDRLGEGLSEADSIPVVERLVQRILGIQVEEKLELQHHQ